MALGDFPIAATAQASGTVTKLPTPPYAPDPLRFFGSTGGLHRCAHPLGRLMRRAVERLGVLGKEIGEGRDRRRRSGGEKRTCLSSPNTMSPDHSSAAVPAFQMNDGRWIPQLGFGVFLVPLDETGRAVLRELRVGYRLIDTAAAYGNEAGVADAIVRTGLERADVFITTKVHNRDHGRDLSRTGFEQNHSADTVAAWARKDSRFVAAGAAARRLVVLGAASREQQ